MAQPFPPKQQVNLLLYQIFSIMSVNPFIDPRQRKAQCEKSTNPLLEGLRLRHKKPFDPSSWTWIRCTMMVHSWIMNYDLDSIDQSIVIIENAFDVLSGLKEWFSQGDLIRILELQQEIYNFKQDAKLITELFPILKIL